MNQKEEVTFSFHKIEKVGYYKNRSESHEFGELTDFLSDLIDWVNQEKMTLEQTCTYEVDTTDDILHTYCVNIIKTRDKDNFFLTMWNEVPSVDGKIPSISATAPIGSSKVKFSKLPKGAIPGYATYFWFIPSRKVFAAIQFQKQLTAKRNLEKFFKSFIAKFSRYVITDIKEDNTLEIIGYTRSDELKIEKVYPCFKSIIYRNPGLLETIKKRRQDIIKIVKKNKLSISSRNEKALWQRMLINLGFSEPPSFEESTKIKYEISYSPTLKELNELIKSWKNDNLKSFNDIGFRFKGDVTKTYWLSTSLAKTKKMISINWINKEILNLDKFKKEILKNREEILKTLK